MDSLWNILKGTLLEKNADGTVNALGSMKRLGAIMSMLTVISICLTCLQPSFSIHIGSFALNFEHSQYKIADYDLTISHLLEAFGAYVGIGEGASAIKNYHNMKYAPDAPDTTTK